MRRTLPQVGLIRPDSMCEIQVGCIPEFFPSAVWLSPVRFRASRMARPNPG